MLLALHQIDEGKLIGCASLLQQNMNSKAASAGAMKKREHAFLAVEGPA